MCNQGRGYIDLWGMGSAGKTWFQGECQIYKKLINHTCLRHKYSKKSNIWVVLTCCLQHTNFKVK